LDLLWWNRFRLRFRWTGFYLWLGLWLWWASFYLWPRLWLWWASFYLWFWRWLLRTGFKLWFYNNSLRFNMLTVNLCFMRIRWLGLCYLSINIRFYLMFYWFILFFWISVDLFALFFYRISYCFFANLLMFNFSFAFNFNRLLLNFPIIFFYRNLFYLSFWRWCKPFSLSN